MKLDVLGLGAAAMDVVLNCQDLPREDGFSFVQSEALVPGGSCANMLAALRGLGFSCGLACKLGDDHYGRAFLTDLASLGVDTRGVRVKRGGVSLHTYITVAAKGVKAIFAHLGDSLLDLSAEEVDPVWLEEAGLFYTDLFPAAPALKLARECRRLGRPVVFNLQVPVDFMGACGVGREEIEEMLELADLFISGAEALEELTGQDQAAAGLQEVCQRHALSVGAVATLGEAGSLWLRHGEFIARPSLPVTAVDTTGAGDAFNAGLLDGLFLLKMPALKCLDLATACAALKCTQPGPRLSATLEQVASLLV